MKGKYIVPLILASVSATTLGAHAQFSVKADYNYGTDTVLSGDLIKISGFKGEGEVGERVFLPSAVVEEGVSTAITVTDPRGKTVTLKTVESKESFVPTLKGYYTVKYSATKDGQMDTVTEELKILIKGNEYSIVLPTNSNYVVPATVKTNQEIKIPMPEVLENDEELAESTIISDQDNTGLKVFAVNKDDSSATAPLAFNAETKTFNFTPTRAGVYEIIYRYYNNGSVQDYKTDSFVAKDNYKGEEIELNFSYKSTKPTTATLGVETTLPSVKVFDKNNATVELDAYVTIKVKHVESGTEFAVEDYKFTPTLKGKYQVSYEASIPLFGITSQKSTFLLEDVKDNLKPELAVTNNYEYTTDDNGKTTITRVYRDVNKNNTFDSGDAELFNATENTDLDKKELENKISEALGNAKYDIPSVVVLTTEGESTAKATVKIPAIYAADNFSDYSKLTFTRSVKSSSGMITEIKKSNEDGTREAYPSNEWAEYTFTTAGDYTIRFEAKDEAGNSYMDSYDIKVLSSDAELKDGEGYLLPTLNFPAITSYAKKTATLTINQPSASDKFDTRVETRVYYSFDPETFNTENEISKLNKDGKLELDLSSITDINSKNKIYIHAVAYNDYAIKNSARQYKKITREINLINTNDSAEPTFTNLNNFFINLATENSLSTIDQFGMITVDGKSTPAFSQKDLVKLPEVIVTDVEDTNLNISLKVKDPYGKTVTVKNSSYSKDVAYDGFGNITLNTYSIKNGSFTVDYSGVYTITYTARDAGGNIISQTFGIRVRDTEKPTIVLSSYDPFASAVEVGKFVEIPAATLTDNGELLTDITTNVPFESKVDGKAGTYWELIEGPALDTMGTVGFTPKVAGDYVIKYYGWDKEGNITESKAHTITAVDTIKPTIKLENDHILTNIAWPDDESNGVTVYAPGVLELYDGYRDTNNSDNDYDQTNVDDITLVVKVYDKNNNLIEGVSEENVETGVDADGNPIYTTRYKFVAESQGVYKITYIATDAAGNSTELTKEVKVGDTTQPEVEWYKSKEDLITTAKLNSSYEFNLDMISIDDIKATDAIKVAENADEAEYTMVVNMYDPSSSVVTNEYKNDADKANSYRWKFEKSGTYELRFVVKDKAGNSTTRSFNIVVSEEDTKEHNVKPIVGTILIVVSALILVGVVVYFVVTGRNKSKTKNAPKTKNKKK